MVKYQKNDEGVGTLNIQNGFRLENDGNKHDYVRPLYAILHYLYNLKNVKNTHGGVLLLVTKSNAPPWVLFTLLNLYKWYQITQMRGTQY